MVESGHDVGFPLDVLPHIWIFNLRESHHLQGHLLVQDDVVGQLHLAKASLAKNNRRELLISNGCQSSVINSHFRWRKLENFG